jgi:hypothetical protein
MVSVDIAAIVALIMKNVLFPKPTFFHIEFVTVLKVHVIPSGEVATLL